MNVLIAVFIGGGLGSVARYLTSQYFVLNFNGIFPFGTLTVNATSSFIAGLLFGTTLLKTEHTSTVRLFAIAGFCGGFSTFSAFSTETFQLLKNDLLWLGTLNIIANIFICLILTAAGIWAGRLLNP
jgi:CrcB protein